MNINVTFPSGWPIPRSYSDTLVNNTALTKVLTVPAGESWLIRGAFMKNGDNVNRDCSCLFKDAAGNNIGFIIYHAALATLNSAYYPDQTNNDTKVYACPILLCAGETLTFTWAAGGASAGGTASYGVIGEKIIL
jgi:hypothetical protein